MDLKHNISFCCTICFNPFKTLSKRHLLFRQEFLINRIMPPSAQFSTFLHCPTKYYTLLGTIHILRKQVSGHFPPTHYISMIYLQIVSKNGHFLNTPTQSYANVIYEWPLRLLYIVEIVQVGEHWCQVMVVEMYKWRNLMTIRIT